MMPLGPQLIRLLHIDTHEFGLLLSSYTFAAAASGLLAATYIDRFDRRKLVLTLYLLFIVATLCCGLAPTYPALLVARALAGAFGGVLGAMVQTMVADIIPFERRGKALGTVMASFSIATVAGVPLGLFLANRLDFLGWRAPFFFIVLLSAGVLLMGLKSLPSMTAHLQPQATRAGMLTAILAVAKDRRHAQAFLFISLLMLAGFSVIPYIALYMTTNVAQPESFLTVVYLCGGAATFFSAQLIGRMADQYGKPVMFRWLCWLSFVPLLITTHMTPVPWWLVLINSTLFFVLVSGRFIPAMAMVSAVPAPQIRGTFMSLMASVQMLASGLATFIAGLIITQTPNGQMVHYNLVGYLAVACGMLAIWLAPHLQASMAPAASSMSRPQTKRPEK